MSSSGQSAGVPASSSSPLAPLATSHHQRQPSFPSGSTTQSPALYHSHHRSLSQSQGFNSGSPNMMIGGANSTSPGPHGNVASIGTSSLAGSPLNPMSNNNLTRILSLSNFSPEMKTRDIQALFGEWEDDRGGFKIKWVDDVSCWIVFNDPGVAKRAYLNLLASPSPSYQAAGIDGRSPKLSAYTGSDTPQILSAVQNRPRSRSNAATSPSEGKNGGHSRKSSLMDSQSGSGSGMGMGMGMGSNNGILGHGRNTSFGSSAANSMRGHRASFGQKQMKDMMEEGDTNDDSVAHTSAT